MKLQGGIDMPVRLLYLRHVCVVTKTVQLQISGLPCNLNSARAIEYVLGPFGLVKSHDSHE